MIYYDAHTHKLPLTYDENIVSIYNAYPLDYEKVKDVENANLFFSCGIHPWYLEDVDEQLILLENIVHDNRVVAIGEAGLDKLCSSDFDLQKKVFRKQIEMSIKTNKPMIIHCVKAWDELIALYKEYKPTRSWIIHGFRGKGELAQQLIHLGMKISIGEKYNRSIFEKIDFDSVLFESDNSDRSIVSICNVISGDLDIMIDDFLSVGSVVFGETFKL